ncbi:Cu(I)-responsive transcriptional regulator [Zavarzinia sp. CC-PAN008]|uniref:Cu(I)-responsive transcriptional regulator n=1 Tax=Zavarzinia sp. CC-PAN008 TaxID=3243332 RepID=UPI003F74202A
MNIGTAARQSGLSPKMIRYYERVGLLPHADRSDGNYRTYSASDVHMLRFVKRARALGFSLAQTGALLKLWQDQGRSSADVKRLALEHVAELEQRMAELAQMAETLRDLARACHGDRRPDCPILGDLAAS